MKKHLLKSLLVGLMTLAATSAWAADKAVVKYSFDDAMSPSLTAGSRVSFDYDKTSVITSTKFLNAYNNANGDPGSSTVSLGSTDLSAETWTLSFEWAACGGCNSKADHTILKAGDTNLFDLTGNSNWNTTVTITYAGSDGTKTLPVPGCDKNKRFTAATGDQLNTTAYWHHIVVTGSSDGVKMTITNSSTGTAVVENVVLSETNVNPTSLIIEPCCGGAIGIDELSLTYYVEGEVVQTPVANYSAVDGIRRTITATCDTEGATLYYSTDGESWTEGASVTVSESGKVYFKAVKGTTESDVLEFDAEAGEAIVLNAPVINRTSNTSVTISCDQTNLLLSPTATVYYTYGEESGSFTGSITLTVAADATITAYAEADGYTTSETSERAVALFPTFVETLESIAAKTSGWSENAFSTETITASERTYAALMLDDVQWGQNVYLQTGGAWGLRASGNWYINSADAESWILMQNMKQGDIIVVNVTYPASSMVNATFSKYTYGTRQAYEVTEDGDVELAFKKPNASVMDYLYGVYAYREIATKTIGLIPNVWAADGAIFAAYAFNSDEDNAWFPFAEIGGAFGTQIPENYAKIIAVRLKPATDESFDTTNNGLNWNNKWNQTDDIDFTALADNTVITITGWGEGEGANSTYTTSTVEVPADLDELKAALQQAITDATALNVAAKDETLADAITAAQAALETEGVTATELAAVATALQIAATDAAKTVLQKAITLVKQFGMDTTAYEALLDNEETTVQQLVAGMMQLLNEGKPAALAGISKAEQFFATFNGEAATALAEDFEKVKTALNGTDIDAMQTAVQALITKALPYAKTAVEKVTEYLSAIDNDDINADIAAIKAAIEANNIVAMVVAANKAQEDFLAAVPGWVNGIEYALALYKDNGKTNGAQAVETYINSVRTVMANEDASIVTVGAVVRNLILALAQFKEANTTYALAGNAEFLGEWDTKANVMTLDGDLYTITFDNVTLENDFELKYKVVKTDIDDNQSWYPEGDDLTYKIWQGTGEYDLTFTFDPKTEEITCSVVPDAIRALIAQAEELAATNGVAVGKLEQAIEKAKVGDYNAEQLQAAMDQYNTDNADQEKDETAKVATDGWKKFDGTAAGICATQFAPAISTYDGRTNVQLAEVYEGSAEGVNRTGTIIYQDITGLQNGKYKVGFYGNAFYTSGRGFESPMEDGASDVAYVFANDEKEFITANIATSTTENNFRQFDVEVTDGTIKLGMGKDKAGTNWHTMQIYQLTWFTTAKEVYAQDKAEMQAAIAAAKALKTENRTNGVEEIDAAIAAAEAALEDNKLNIAEFEAEIAKIKAAAEVFEKANYFIDFAAGEYYIIDAETDLKMAAGNNYGTRGIVNELGLDLTLTPYTESRTVTIDSRVSNGGDNHFLGQNLYMDSSEWGWALEYRGFAFYILDPNTQKYINIDENNNLVLSETPREFIIVSKEGVYEQRMEELEAATATNPVDATFLLQNPNFNRNDQRVSAWVVTFTEGDNSNLNGGNGVNNCGESFHAAFNVMQTVEGAPKGMYELTAQGFYRQDTYEGEEAPAAPVFFANGVNKDVPVRTGSEDSMSAASESFTNGLYTIDPIKFDVTDEGEDSGKIYVGVTTAVTNQWVIFDNFRLLYYGKDSTTGISELTANGQNAAAAEGIYNLQGQRVEKAKKGLYIVNGKKVVKK